MSVEIVNRSNVIEVKGQYIMNLNFNELLINKKKV
jgi:hypothetical protein